MPVELTPAGTRGTPIRQPPKWLMGLAQPIVDMVLGRRMRLLKLTTVGAKSGNAHRVSLSYFPAGQDAWYVVASYRRLGQAPRLVLQHGQAPGPDLDRAGRPHGPRRRRNRHRRGARAAWREIVATWKGYADYQTRTDRVIPVVKLTPA